MTWEYDAWQLEREGLQNAMIDDAYYGAENALTAWDIERQMAQVAREANGLEWRAWEHHDDYRTEDAEALLDMSEARWRDYVDLRARLHEIEGGF